MKIRLEHVVWYLIASAFGLALILARSHVTGRMAFLYLPWNLFLGWLPLLFAWLTVRAAGEAARPPWPVPIWGAVWLLFFPNAPYVLTDLVHIASPWGNRQVSWWFDLFTHVHFALTALLLGYVSLAAMQSLVRRYYGGLVAWAFAVGAMLLAGFGVYLGRVLRWNSWDVLRSPTPVFDDIANRLVNPSVRSGPVGFSLLFGSLLVLGYLMCRGFAGSLPAPDSTGQRDATTASSDPGC